MIVTARKTILLIVPLFLSALSASSSQDAAPVDFTKLPELPAHRLPKDEYLIFNARFGPASADFVRKLRKVPAIHPEGTPTSLIFERYLHKKSTALQASCSYIETDWLTVDELATVASVVQQVAEVTTQVVGTKKKESIKLVLAKKQEDYYSLVDAWAETDKVRRQARAAASAVIGEYRCGQRSELSQVLTLACADSVSANLDPYLWNQHILSEGLHTYITILLGLGYEHYISLNATTPVVKRATSPNELFETAREYLNRPKREALEVILRSELNELNPERMSVAFALIHYLLEVQKDHWEGFLSTLEKESSENGKLKGPEGLWQALSTAISESLGMNVEALDKALKEFVSRRYLYPEEIALLLGVDKECADSTFQGFIKICELKRQKKPISEKGEKIYQDILSRIEKKRLTGSEKF